MASLFQSILKPNINPSFTGGFTPPAAPAPSLTPTNNFSLTGGFTPPGTQVPNMSIAPLGQQAPMQTFFGPATPYQAPNMSAPIPIANVGGQPMAPAPVIPTGGASNALNMQLGTSAANAANYASATPAGTTAPTTQQTFSQQVTDVYNKLAGKAARTNEINEDQGVLDKKQEVAQISQQMHALDDSFNTTVENILRSGGGTLEQASPQIDALRRGYQAEKTRLAIQGEIAQGNYQAAFDNAKALVDAEFEPYEIQLEALKMQIDMNRHDLTDSQRLKAEQAYQTQRDALDFQRQKQLLSYKAAIDAASGGSGGTLNGKPQNQAQSAAQSYATRLAEANLTLDSLGGKFTGAGTSISNTLGGLVPNFLKGGDRQAVEQAQKNFVTAILRRESGASISPTEFNTAAEIYFPQPGDAPTTVAQKAITRNTAINNMYREANVARPVLPGQIIESDGKRYRVGADGQSLTQI